jgi:hypothetical protein
VISRFRGPLACRRFAGRTVSFLRPLATLQSRPGQFDRKRSIALMRLICARR